VQILQRPLAAETLYQKPDEAASVNAAGGWAPGGESRSPVAIGDKALRVYL
jgi:hypothetical protein